MKLFLEELNIKNFKGVIEASYKFGQVTNVYGANEKGKTTIMTAFFWLLTGKDEYDRKDYEIKNTKRRELNQLAHEVEGTFHVNEETIILKRSYIEVWKTSKGKAKPEFTGHTTNYWYNNVPCNEKEYQEKVNAIIPTNIIKLVTNPTYFNSLTIENQRKGLLMIAGEITASDVIEKIATPQNDYAALIGALNSKKTVEEWKKELAAKRKLLEKNRVEYAPRIDELKRNLPESANWTKLEKEIAAKQAEIDQIEENLQNESKALKSKQDVLTGLQRELYTKETQLTSIRNKVKTDFLASHDTSAIDVEIRSVEAEIRAINNSLLSINKNIADSESNKSAYQNQISAKDLIINQCREKWIALNSEEFKFDETACVCPTCKQSLPANDIEAQKEKLLANFNEHKINGKAKQIEISDQAKKEKKQLEENIASIDATDYKSQISEKESELETSKSKLTSLIAKKNEKPVIDTEAAVEKLMTVNAEALNLVDEIAELNKKIAAQTVKLGESIDDVSFKQRKSTLQFEIKDLERILAVKSTIEATNKRIAQLENEAALNAQEIADIEQQEFECESFVRAKSDILQERVNSMFKFVSFRLFHKQVDGNIAETCVCEYNDVPYPTQNTASRLLMGLDVLNTFSKYYDVYAPVFCDNRESVTYIPEVKSQVISLFVSPADSKKIRVEIEEGMAMEISQNGTLFN